MKFRIFSFLLIGLYMVCFSSVEAKVLYSIDFSEQANGSAIEWLKKNQFDLKEDAKKLSPQFQDGKLYLEAKGKVLGLFSKEVNIKSAKKIRLIWGVDEYPKGANWEKGILREPLAVIVTFGKEKVSSGNWIVPNLPRFFSLFIGETEKEGKAYLGKYWKKGARYFCAACGIPKGKSITTEFELSDRFKKIFSKSSVPAITGVGIEVDVRDTNGKSKAFLQKIEFLD